MLENIRAILKECQKHLDIANPGKSTKAKKAIIDCSVDNWKTGDNFTKKDLQHLIKTLLTNNIDAHSFFGKNRLRHRTDGAQVIKLLQSLLEGETDSLDLKNNKLQRYYSKVSWQRYLLVQLTPAEIRLTS